MCCSPWAAKSRTWQGDWTTATGMITFKKKFNKINHWRKKQVSAPGSVLRSMTPTPPGGKGAEKTHEWGEEDRQDPSRDFWCWGWSSCLERKKCFIPAAPHLLYPGFVLKCMDKASQIGMDETPVLISWTVQICFPYWNRRGNLDNAGWDMEIIPHWWEKKHYKVCALWLLNRHLWNKPLLFPLRKPAWRLTLSLG